MCEVVCREITEFLGKSKQSFLEDFRDGGEQFIRRFVKAKLAPVFDKLQAGQKLLAAISAARSARNTVDICSPNNKL
jgi:hypothetical protein